MRFPVTPVGKPRMTKRDRWAQRPAVVRYWAYCDAMRAYAEQEGFEPKEAGMALTFYLPMPTSWSKKKKEAMNGQPHQQKPDVDNLVKAFLDALLGDDAKVWHLAGVQKRWAYEGAIVVKLEEVTREEEKGPADEAQKRRVRRKLAANG